jgi:hypothetical protein
MSMTINPADAFSQSYAEARAKFRATAQAAGADLTALKHPMLGPNGEELACDVARFGATDAPAVLWINSATHGVEGYCGSGVQIGMMALGWHRQLPAGVALLLTHAINPHGFAWTRRVNEDNVDLNRNFGPQGVALPVNPGYADIHQWVIPEAFDGAQREAADAALEHYRVQHGDRAFSQAMSGGQFAYPKGLFYGGLTPTWSNLTLRALIDRQLAQAKRFCFIDIHTGLGPLGYGEPSYVGDPTEAALAECRRWLGDDVSWLERGTGQSTPLHGHIGLPFRPLYAQAKTGPVLGLEFGTLPSAEVRAALRAVRKRIEHVVGGRGVERRREVRFIHAHQRPARAVLKEDDAAESLVGERIALRERDVRDQLAYRSLRVEVAAPREIRHEQRTGKSEDRHDDQHLDEGVAASNRLEHAGSAAHGVPRSFDRLITGRATRREASRSRSRASGR